eukprot:TRINITY_DN14402_c0_g5_i1.p1 TRINITY_DN14402_c0_g5~~TRINITY_DN14402_c0_g5_i1.p1  ORF type:complete len:436 (+),score=60.09 TRINITY_DN14402_c0_g5_i1:142-1449(+)
MFCSSVLALTALVCFHSLAHAVPYAGPVCRHKSVFPYLTCEPSQNMCFPERAAAERFCLPKQPFGCAVQSCSDAGYSCKLEAEQTSCGHGEIAASHVNLTEALPLTINLRLNPYPPIIDVVLLIDAAESAKPHFEAIKPELVAFLNRLDTSHSLKAGVAVYGPEASLDSSGILALSQMDQDVSKAIEALDRIPEYSEGPRTTFRAIYNIGQSLRAFAARKLVFLIGNSAAREPDCHYLNREVTANDMYGYTASHSIIPISIGAPGLDAALPEPAACPNNPYIETAPVAAGQATYLATNTAGEVITDVSAQRLLDAVDSIRRRPPRKNGVPPGSSYSYTTASVPLGDPRVVPPQFLRYSNGCGNKVSAQVSNLPAFISAPNVEIASMELTLKNGVCTAGVPFTCEIRVREHVNTNPIPNVHNRPLVKTEIIHVHAC